MDKTLIGISIEVDDGGETDYTEIYSYLQSKGLPTVGTSALNTAMIGSEVKLKHTQLDEMYANGWSFQCHSSNHDDLTTLTEQQLRDDLQSVNQFFINKGWSTPEQHYLPFKAFNQSVLNVLYEYRKYVINLLGDPFPRKLSDIQDWKYKEFNDRGVPLTRVLKGDIQDDANYNETISAIDDLKNGKINYLVIRGHGVHVEPPSIYHYQKTYFRNMIDYIADSGLPLVSVEEGLKQLEAWDWNLNPIL